MKTSSEDDTDLLRAENDALRRKLARYEAGHQSGEPNGHETIWQAAARESELQSILDKVPVIISSVDRHGLFRRVNRAYEEVFRHTAEWVVGRHLSEVAGEPHSTIAKPYVARALKGESVSFESSIRDREGKLCAIRVFYVPQHDNDGEPDGFIAMVENITERKASEAALRQSEIRFRSFFNLAATGMSLARVPDGHFLEVNEKFAEILGYTPTELLQKSFLEITHPDDIDLNEQLYRELVEQRVPHFEYEKRFIHRNGHPVWVQVTVSVVSDELGTPQYTIAVIEDISERKRSEQALRDSERHLRTLAETLPQLVWTCLPNGDCDYLSRQWVAYTGIPEEQQLGLNWLDAVMHPDDRELTYAAWMSAVADQAGYDLEYRLRRFDGVYRWFKTRGTPVRDGSGQIVRWFGTCTDIDDQRNAEEERKQLLAREQRARAAAELLNRIGPMLITELDSRTLIQRVTDLATELVRAELGALFHNVVNEQGESYMLYSLSGVPPEAFSKFPMPRNTAVFGPTFRGEGAVLSSDITKDPRYGLSAPHFGMPKGHLPVRSYLAVPVTSRSGEVLGGLFFGHSQPGIFSEQDAELVTGIAAQAAIALDNARLFAASEHTQEALRQSNQELQRANADLEQFAFAAAHDLQEPLRMVTSYAQLLERAVKNSLEKRTQDYLDYIVGGSKRMSLLLQDLLAYTETSRDSEIPAGSVDLNRVLMQVLRNLENAISDSSAVITSEDLPEVVGREAHFLQLLQNLIGNAIKYSKPNEVPRISVSVQPNGEDWLFKVSDNGVGIEPAYHKQVFGVFKRLHGSEIPGTGIGLAICQRVVERAGGRIWVESELSAGSAFCFTIPRASR